MFWNIMCIFVLVLLITPTFTLGYKVSFGPRTQFVQLSSNAKLGCEVKVTRHNFDYVGISKFGAKICDIKQNKYKCYEPNVECSSCFMNETYAKLDITIKNVTAEDIGEYRCDTGNATKHARIVMSEPPKTECYKTLNEVRSNDLEIITCDIGCTYPEPKITFLNNAYQIITDLEDKVELCEHQNKGLKRYKTQFAVKKPENGFCGILVSSLGYHEIIRVYFNDEEKLSVTKVALKTVNSTKFPLKSLIATEVPLKPQLPNSLVITIVCLFIVMLAPILAIATYKYKKRNWYSRHMAQNNATNHEMIGLAKDPPPYTENEGVEDGQI